jgi:hypothetical protein
MSHRAVAEHLAKPVNRMMLCSMRCKVCLHALQPVLCLTTDSQGLAVQQSPDVARWKSAAVAAACTAILMGSAVPWNSQCNHTYPAANSPSERQLRRTRTSAKHSPCWRCPGTMP